MNETREIKELDMNKYRVLKTEDVLRFCNEKEIGALTDLMIKIDLCRKKEGKKINKYLVLNLDNEIVSHLGID